MRSLIDYTIRQKIRNVTEIRVTVESVAIPSIGHTFHVTPENLARPQSLYVSKLITIKYSFQLDKNERNSLGSYRLKMHLER